MAHQWWYGLVGNDSVREPWLDEALATYAALIALEERQGPEARNRLLAQWDEAGEPRGPGDPPVNSSTLAFSSWVAYHTTAYTRGALFLEELRGALGDERFFELLGRYQASYRYRMATTRDFLSLAEAVGGRDLDVLFADWFNMDAVQVEDDGRAPEWGFQRSSGASGFGIPIPRLVRPHFEMHPPLSPLRQ